MALGFGVTLSGSEVEQVWGNAMGDLGPNAIIEVDSPYGVMRSRCF